MRVRTQKAIAFVLVFSLVLGLLVSILALASRAADAHAELARSVPRPGQAVGGLIDRVEMEFRDPIRPHGSNGVALQYPDGTRSLAAITVDRHLVRGRFDPLAESGRYRVVWELLDQSDGDWATEEFEFTYDSAAEPPEWLPASAAEGSAGRGGFSGAAVAMAVIAPLAAALAAWIFWPRRRRAARARVPRSARVDKPG